MDTKVAGRDVLAVVLTDVGYLRHTLSRIVDLVTDQDFGIKNVAKDFLDEDD